MGHVLQNEIFESVGNIALVCFRVTKYCCANACHQQCSRAVLVIVWHLQLLKTQQFI